MSDISINDCYAPNSVLPYVIKGMRNPYNSWHLSDSDYISYGKESYQVGERDKHLMNTLCAAGTDHRKFMRMMPVYMNITAPLYWWKEFDTYKVGTVANSCSTMHTLTKMPFTIDDFAHDQMTPEAIELLNAIITTLNALRLAYLESDKGEYWYAIVQLLPSSYKQTRTVMLNYEVLNRMYHARKNHYLDEWHVFCDTLKKFPYSELIIKDPKELA